MRADWTPMRHALAACRGDKVAIPFWWRDDDATEPTLALDRLAELSTQRGLPIHLATIPAKAGEAIARHIDPDRLIPVVHGWAHADHSADGYKKNEFLTPRADAVKETGLALAHMKSLFGPGLRTMFVPPWNRIASDVIAALPGQGYTALSTFLPRLAPEAVGGLAQINTHIDPIDWRGSRDLVMPDRLIAITARHLEARRLRQEDSHEPFGLLTHHLVHSEAIWTFASAFVAEMLDGGATPWIMENPN